MTQVTAKIISRYISPSSAQTKVPHCRNSVTIIDCKKGRPNRSMTTRSTRFPQNMNSTTDFAGNCFQHTCNDCRILFLGSLSGVAERRRPAPDHELPERLWPRRRRYGDRGQDRSLSGSRRSLGRNGQSPGRDYDLRGYLETHRLLARLWRRRAVTLFGDTGRIDDPRLLRRIVS
jgi:hypothetical protein